MLITILLPAQHGQRRGNFIAAAIIVGRAIAGSLFLLWPDMMFGISSFNAQNTGGAPRAVSDFTLAVLQGIPPTGWAHPTGHRLLCYHAARPLRGCHVWKNILTGNSGVDLYRIVYPVVAAVDVIYPQCVLALLLKVINLPCSRLVLAPRGRHELAAPLQHVS